MGSVTERAFGYLIDTHALLWWLFDDPKLSRVAFELIRNPDNAIARGMGVAS